MTDLQQTFKGQTGRDEFKRERVADRLIALMSSKIDISPMIIDGDFSSRCIFVYPSTDKPGLFDDLINAFFKL